MPLGICGETEGSHFPEARPRGDGTLNSISSCSRPQPATPPDAMTVKAANCKAGPASPSQYRTQRGRLEWSGLVHTLHLLPETAQAQHYPTLVHCLACPGALLPPHLFHNRRSMSESWLAASAQRLEQNTPSVPASNPCASLEGHDVLPQVEASLPAAGNPGHPIPHQQRHMRPPQQA